jgi:DNA-binding MarR family transcriptional regulator
MTSIPQFSPIEEQIHNALRNRARNNRALASFSELASETGYTRAYVVKTMRRLVLRGVLERHHQPAEDGFGPGANLYILKPEAEG